MPLNLEDVDVLSAERDAEPDRFRSVDPSDHFPETYERVHENTRPNTRTNTRTTSHLSRADEKLEEVERLPTAHRASSYASTSSRSTVTRRPSFRPQNSAMTAKSENLEAKFMNYLERHPTAIQRMQDHRLQHYATVGSGKAASKPLPDFGGNKPYPPLLPEREEYVVEFSGHDDSRHAQNWPLKKKIRVSAVLLWGSLAATFASSIFSAASSEVMREFHIGSEVATLGTSLFVLGYAFGPIIWAPMSELYGRKLPVVIASFGFGLFQIAVAVAKDTQQIMICRFFGGLFGSCLLAITPAVFADMFDNRYRGLGIAMFGAIIMNGPFMAPFIGGFITKSYLGWRWTCYIPAFMAFACCILAVFFVEESYGPVILVSKASELRRLTRNWGIHAKQEEVEVDLKELAVKNISRPMRILFTEPIVLFVTLYMSFMYGLLYLSLTAFGIVFGEIHGFSLGVAGLPYFGMVIGVCIASLLLILTNAGYVRKLQANNNIPVPEWRMPPAMLGGICFTIGLFWFGWTGYTKSIPWIVPTLAGLFLGFGLFIVFLQGLNYIVDAYLMFSASAVAANTFMRSIFGAVFPLFARYMFDGIGINWGMTFLGCLSALFIPLPFLFYFYGKRIRSKSKIAPAPDIAAEQKRDLESGSGSDDLEKKD
ncbi:MFS general substrate transporter [Polychaeton citri CBS 116435]|uniref:Cercosporin MFS transporter CTB4 n=1 Tax=Polychaeton citri CBS 116435 TaxID=1314669 RepID=A0A9P4UTF2_9PEZI|nr:MFS general substrate transporter [Polychaeton citri CBS 116435]